MEPKLFDIHSHLNLPAFNEDWPAVLERTLAADCWTITVGADLASSKKAVEIANWEPASAKGSGVARGVWATVGFHPTDAVDLTDEAWNEVAGLAKDKKVVAIGECGFEYFSRIPNSQFPISKKEKQKDLFKKHIELALELDKPLMIHCRASQKPLAEAGRASEDSQDAYEDVIEILGEYKHQAGDKLRGNFHFFAGDWAVAQKCLDLGFTLSFTGVITFASQYDEVIKNTPLDKLLAETDAPFVAPVPYRGKRCEPLYVVEVVGKLAELRGLSALEMAKNTVQNSRRLFGV